MVDNRRLGWFAIETGKVGGYRGTWTDGEGREWEYTLRWERTPRQWLECTGIELRGMEQQPLSTEVMRLPLGQLIDQARRDLLASQEWFADTFPGALPDQDEAVARVRAWTDERRSGPRGYDGDHFAEVARVYQRGLMTSGKPTLAVAEHFVVSKSAAAKWVARARSMGLLPPAQKGRAG